MAFNWQTFRTRTLTAAVFVIVMLAGLLWNQWSFLVLFSIIHFGCWWEYLKLLEKINKATYHPYVKLGFMVIGYGLMLWFCGPEYIIRQYELNPNLSLPVSAAGFVLLVTGIFQSRKIGGRSFGAAALGLLYISLSWGLMMSLYNFRVSDYILASQFSPKTIPVFPFLWIFPVCIIGSIWINDTMAYIVGSIIGKTPLSRISPKKTWEGTIGGIILSVVVTGLLFSTFMTESVAPGFHFSIAKPFWYLFAAVAAVAGTFGDLLESKLKRMADVKDSGHIMPGHGGFLDRFDSLLLSVPFVWLFVKIFLF